MGVTQGRDLLKHPLLGNPLSPPHYGKPWFVFYGYPLSFFYKSLYVSRAKLAITCIYNLISSCIIMENKWKSIIKKVMLTVK